MRKKIVTAVLLISSVFLVSCGVSGNAEPQRNTDIGLPAHEYNIYLSTEVNTVLNQLTTRMANARFIADGIDAAENEIASTDYSIGVVEKCLDTVKDINITGSYVVDRDEAIRLFEQVLIELNVYKANISTGNTEEIRNCISRMEMLCSSLTSLGNQIYK